MLKVNERLGDFEIVRLLGKGGMGEVYEARQRNPERPVALKVLAPWLADDDDALQRFWREAQVPANLDHPSIVRIISTGKTDDGVAYYTMHLVRGISLAEVIRRARGAPGIDPATQATHDTPLAGPDGEHESRPLPATDEAPITMLRSYVSDRYATTARIGAQVARALAYAHQQGFLHRDIKPSNLMVDLHNQVYLVDFGLTRALHPEEDGTQPGILTGTPWYMSPEQAEGRPLDSRSDIYSLGITLYELATQGLGPFAASRQDKAGVLKQVRAGELLPLRGLASDIPPALECIITRAVSRIPEERYADAAELARDLETFATGILSDLSTQEFERRPAPRRAIWPVALGAAFTITAIVVALPTVLWRGDRDKPALDGRNAWPDSLRQMTPNTPISLLKNDHEPVWSDLLLGSGKYTLWQHQLELFSPPADAVTMLALADPDRSEFEFAIELNYLKSFDPKLKNEIGIFFGWQRQPDGGDGRHRYFLLKLDETPADKAPQGSLTLGTGFQIEKRGARAEGGQWFLPLPDDKARIPLPRSKVWHTLKLRVAGDRFTVAVGDTVVREITMVEVREKSLITDPKLGTLGAVGIWTSKGRGFFRRASITAFPL